LRIDRIEVAMPIYEYRCSSCGHELEALQKLSEAPLRECPSCNTESLVKQVSAAGFQLKGSGWYATDFKGGSKPAADKSSDTPKANGEAKGEAKGETKGATKGETKTETKSETKSDAAAPTGS
jgi:putative FmdB family regulatory protein